MNNFQNYNDWGCYPPPFFLFFYKFFMFNYKNMSNIARAFLGEDNSILGN